MNISRKLSSLMKERGETNYRLAKEIGVSQSTIANWLVGTEPTGLALKAVANHFGCEIDDLAGDYDDSVRN